MKLATWRDGTRDGRLCVVSRDGQRLTPAVDVAPTLQGALDAWERCEPQLRAMAGRLESGEIQGEVVDPRQLAAPLPRAYEWIDGSAYLNHIILVRKARGAEPPETLATDPLVYQGGYGDRLGPSDQLVRVAAEWGCGTEDVVCAIVGDVPTRYRPATS